MPKDQGGKGKDSYTFIQETIVPKKKKKWKKILSMVGSTIVLAILFGLVARATFCFSEPLFSRIFGVLPSEPPEEEGGVLLPGEEEQKPGEEMGSEQEREPVNKGEEDSSSDSAKAPGEGTPDDEDQKGENAGADKDEKPKQIIIEKTIKATISDFSNIYRQIGELAVELNHSIVQVASVTNGVDWFQNPYETEAVTSGLILAIDETNIYILVSYDKIEQASEIRVTFEQEYPTMAKFCDAQPDMGLAVISVRKSELPDVTMEQLIAAPLGESYSMAVGEPVIALGNPNGYMYSMLLGMVTNKVNYAYVVDNKLELFNTDMMLGEMGEGFIVNMEGRIVGLITQSLGGNPGMCTALSISRIKPLLEKLINRTPRVYLGIVGADLSSSMVDKLGQNGGIYVTDVEADSPAGLEGIKSGDILLQVGENNSLSMAGFGTFIQSMNAGDEVLVRVYRMVREEAEELEFTVTLGQKNQSNK